MISCKAVLLITLLSSLAGFLFGLIFIGTEDIYRNLKNLQKYVETDRNYLQRGKQADATRQKLVKAEKLFRYGPLPKSRRNGIQGICSMRNVSGKVLSHDLTSWTINHDVCNIKDLNQSGFVRADLRGRENVPIFTYKAVDDVWVSANVIRQGMWEGDLVKKIHDILSKYPQSDFIDIGANIGVFSLTAAKLGRRVISIDAFEGNIARLCKSVEVGDLTSNIVLIHNAVSNVKEKVALGEDRKNIGGTFVRKLKLNTQEKYIVNSILLDDLLEIFSLKKVVIKMDAERSEARILEGGRKFFKSVDVTHILLEFQFHRGSQSGEFISNFLKEYGLEPQVPADMLKNYFKWPHNVLFTKAGL